MILGDGSRFTKKLAETHSEMGSDFFFFFFNSFGKYRTKNFVGVEQGMVN